MNGRKYNTILGAIILILITAIITFTFTSIISIQLGDKIIISKNDYKDLEGLSKLINIRNLLEENFVDELDREQLYEGAIKGIIDTLEDPYAAYYTEEEYKELRESAKGVYSGVGLLVTIDRNDKTIMVVNPFETGPAYKAGILPGDKLVKVQGEDVPSITSVDEFNKVIELLKGPVGEEVTVTISRGNEKKDLLEFTLIKEIIKAPNINAHLIDDRIGYMRILTFNSNTVSNEFEEKLVGLMNNNIEGLIIDVRDNTGGILGQCIDIVDHLVPRGLIVSTRHRNGEEKEYHATKDWVDLPMVVLINENTSSASEILAGAVKDRKTGILVGTKTYGKGIVQSVVSLKDNSGLKFTESRYYTPSGVSIHEIGIEPDIKLELDKQFNSSFMVPEDKDTQLQKAISVLNEMID